MAKLRFSGPFLLRLRSFLTLNRIALATFLRHAVGQRIALDWDASFEIGIRFWRHQFTAAMRHPDIARGRLLFDSVQTETDDRYDVTAKPNATPKGMWYHPGAPRCDATLLFFHGGGYTFHGCAPGPISAIAGRACAAMIGTISFRGGWF